MICFVIFIRWVIINKQQIKIACIINPLNPIIGLSKMMIILTTTKLICEVLFVLTKGHHITHGQRVARLYPTLKFQNDYHYEFKLLYTVIGIL